MIKIKNQKLNFKNRGFTLIELAIVTSIIVILLGFITISLVRSQQKASLMAVEGIILADLKEQQIKAMSGETEGRTSSDSYGIHFDSDKYVLFHGPTYSPTDSSNYVTNLDSNMQFNTPNTDVIFSRLSGELQSPIVIELEDKTNSSRLTIYINELGVITQVESS